MQDLKAVLSDIYSNAKIAEEKDTIATYIPELATIDIANFGVNLRTLSDKSYGDGNYATPFSIQSISKVLALSKRPDLTKKEIRYLACKL